MAIKLTLPYTVRYLIERRCASVQMKNGKGLTPLAVAIHYYPGGDETSPHHLYHHHCTTETLNVLKSQAMRVHMWRLIADTLERNRATLG